MYDFTTSWFENTARQTWDLFFEEYKPSTILEIGSFEGASICYMIDKLAQEQDLYITCVDTWKGGEEHSNYEMDTVFERFKSNTSLAIDNATHNVSLKIQQHTSDKALISMLNNGWEEMFDLVYVDGSHQPQDVLLDCVLGFKLLRDGGVMIMDDYDYWHEQRRIDRSPKLAIDSFVNIYYNQLIVRSKYNGSQFFVEKRNQK